MLTHIQATHHGAVMASCFHDTLPLLVAISPVLVAHSQHHHQDTIYLFLWGTMRRGIDLPLCHSCWHRGWGKGKECGHARDTTVKALHC